MRPRLAKLESEELGEPMPSAKEIYEMVAEAAYYRAEKRGFTAGLEANDWRKAEAEVMEKIRAIRGQS